MDNSIDEAMAGFCTHIQVTIAPDGSFSGVLTEGDGVFAQKLRERGVPVYGESDIPRLLEEAGTAAFPNS